MRDRCCASTWDVPKRTANVKFQPEWIIEPNYKEVLGMLYEKWGGTGKGGIIVFFQNVAVTKDKEIAVEMLQIKGG